MIFLSELNVIVTIGSALRRSSSRIVNPNTAFTGAFVLNKLFQLIYAKVLGACKTDYYVIVEGSNVGTFNYKR